MIACDMDGTLLDMNFIISKADKEAISKAHAKGVIFTLCSGRSYVSLVKYAKELGVATKGSHVIGFNGGVIYDPHDNIILNEETLDVGIASEVCRFFNNLALDVEIVAYINGENVLFEEGAVFAHEYQKTSAVKWRSVKDFPHAVKSQDTIAKIIFIGENTLLKNLEVALQRKFGDRIAVFFTSKHLLEVTSKDCSKANGVKWVCGKLGIDLVDVIAIGDNYNDLSMIAAAGLGVAVANAVPAAKDIANYITTKSCSESAVAEVIEKFVL